MDHTYLAQAVAATEHASSYDTNAKFLLADKQILARILKYAVTEFQDMAIKDIISCIGNDIEVGIRPVDPGLSNTGRVKENHTEDNIPGEGKIFFDIRFTAYHDGIEIKFLINVEAQNSSTAITTASNRCGASGSVGMLRQTEILSRRSAWYAGQFLAGRRTPGRLAWQKVS